ncbi:MAG: HAD family hydrolase [Planctomycetota bacterium]
MPCRGGSRSPAIASSAAPGLPVSRPAEPGLNEPTADEPPVDEPAPVSRAAPPAAVRLLAIGVDGTMLRSDGHLPRGVIQACRAAERAGCVVVPATARAPRAVEPVARALELTGPVIASNGAVIWNPRAHRPQHHQPLERAIVEELIAEVRGRHPEVLVALESLESWHTDRLDQRFEDGPVLDPDQIGPLERFYDRPLTRIELAGAPDVMASVATLLRERYWRPRRIGMFVTEAGVVQVTHPLVDKAIALQRIAARLGVDRQQVMAIGDGDSDQGMVEWAGFGVAVANACPGVKRLADEVVPSNDELGVARAIQRFVLLRS